MMVLEDLMKGKGLTMTAHAKMQEHVNHGSASLEMVCKKAKENPKEPYDDQLNLSRLSHLNSSK